MTDLKSASGETVTLPPVGLATERLDGAAQSGDLAGLVPMLTSLALAGERDALDAFFQDLRSFGHDMRLLYRDLVEPAARELGDRWSEDRLTSFEVTVALTHLQQSVRRIGARIAPTVEPGDEQVRDVLILSHPAEPSILGATLAGDVFRNAGWFVQVEFPQTDSEALASVRAARYHVLVFLLGDVRSHADKLDSVAACIASLRKTSRNRDIGVIVGGRAVLDRPEATAAAVGAEAAFTTAADAFEKACDFLKIRRQRVAWRLLSRPNLSAGGKEAWPGWLTPEIGVERVESPSTRRGK